MFGTSCDWPIGSSAVPLRSGEPLRRHPQKLGGLIVDMSAPEGTSINDGVRESLTYVTVADAVQSITRLGQGALLAKVDIKSAYRNVPIHPEDRWLSVRTAVGSENFHGSC